MVAEELHNMEKSKDKGAVTEEEYKASIHKAPAKVLQKYWDECITVSGGGSSPNASEGSDKKPMSKIPPKGFDPKRDGPWNPAGAKTVNVSAKRAPEWQFSG
jgi:hypothetical protein